MDDSLLPVKQVDRAHIFFFDALWQEDKTLVVDFLAYVVAHPVLIVQAKECRVDRLDQSSRLCSHLLKHLAGRTGLHRLTLAQTVAFAGNEYIVNIEIVVVEQIYIPQRIAVLFIAGDRYRHTAHFIVW